MSNYGDTINEMSAQGIAYALPIKTVVISDGNITAGTASLTNADISVERHLERRRDRSCL